MQLICSIVTVGRLMAEIQDLSLSTHSLRPPPTPSDCPPNGYVPIPRRRTAGTASTPCRDRDILYGVGGRKGDREMRLKDKERGSGVGRGEGRMTESEMRSKCLLSSDL